MRMAYNDSLKYKIQERLNHLAGHVVMRRDLDDLGSFRQISRGLKALQKEGQLVRIGFGVYAKAYRSPYIDTPVIQGGFTTVSREALNRLGVQWEPGTAEQDYNAGRSTQVPVRPVVKLKSRFRRKIAYGQQALVVERGTNAR